MPPGEHLLWPSAAGRLMCLPSCPRRSEPSRNADRGLEATQIEVVVIKSVARRGATESVPSLQPPHEPRAHRYVNSREGMGGGCRTVRFEGEVEDVECFNIDKVPLLSESVPDDAGTPSDERHPLRWDPGELADGPASIAEVEPRADRQRHPCERRPLFDREIVEIHPVSHFRSDIAPRVPEIQRNIEALTASEGDLDSPGRGVEIPAAQGQLITRVVQHRATGVGNRVSKVDAHLNPRLLEEEALATALSEGPGREKQGGSDQEKRRLHSTPVTDQDFPPCFVPLPTLAVAAINARGVPDSGEGSSAEFFATRPASGTIRGHGVSPTWDIAIPDTGSGKKGPWAWAREPLPSHLCDRALDLGDLV